MNVLENCSGKRSHDFRFKKVVNLAVSTWHRNLHKQARYGPPDRYESPPSAGMCISVFAIVRPEKRQGVLVGVPKPGERWLSEWVSGWRMYSKEELANIYQQWRLPSGYLEEGEHPDDAVRRVIEDQIHIRRYNVSKNPKIYSYSSASDWYPGKYHWDLVFVYDVMVKSNQPPKSQELWRELHYLEKKELVGKDFGWNSDFMHDLKLV